MSLTLVTSRSEVLISSALTSRFARALKGSGTATLLLPNRDLVTSAQRVLAAMPGMGLGVTCTTPTSWVSSQWSLVGDGKEVVDDLNRLALLQLLVSDTITQTGSSLQPTKGTLELLSKLAKGYLASLPLSQSGEVETWAAASLSAEEASCLELLGRYSDALASHNKLEVCQAAVELPAFLARTKATPEALFVAGHDSFDLSLRTLLANMAALCDVTVVLRCDDGPAGQLARDAAAGLKQACEQNGIVVDEIDEPAHPAEKVERAPQLDALRSRVFRPQGPDGPLAPTDVVSLAHAAGERAEAHLVCESVMSAAAAGARELVVTVADADRAWRELVPQLVGRGLRVTCTSSRRVLATPEGSSFMAFCESVANLIELDATWPEPTTDEHGTLINLGDMSWWPPRDIIDFLLNDLSGVTRESAWRLDASWRSNRLLTPRRCLDDLMRAQTTSTKVARLVQDLMQGKLVAATRRLASTQQPGSSAAAVLSAIADCAAAAAAAGVSASTVPLSQMCAFVHLLLNLRSVAASGETGDESSDVHVVVTTARTCAHLDAGSADAVIMCGLTTVESPVAPSNDEFHGIIESLDLEPRANVMAQARATFLSCLSVARERVVFERSLLNLDSEPTYPSVMLSEVQACYMPEGDDDAKLEMPVVLAEETQVTANLDVHGATQAALGSCPRTPEGTLSPVSTPFVMVPRGNVDVSGLPNLSASQIESYLECPLKWFTMRRLRLNDSDAGFTGMEMGTFVHRVLEVTHRTMLQQAAADIDPDVLAADPSLHVSGSAVTDETLEVAQRLLDEEFEKHRLHQYRTGQPSGAQLLVPHDVMQQGDIRALHESLTALLRFETGVFENFEPRLFEQRFGGSKGIRVTYAGADFDGSIDRVDVDGHGRALIIDYKHKNGGNALTEYALSVPGRHFDSLGITLPRHVQTLIYAQVARRAYPRLKVCGSVYLLTRSNPSIAGAIETNAVDAVLGASITKKRREACDVAQKDAGSLNDLLDSTEQAISQTVRDMRAGIIPADPLDAMACSFCPVIDCSRRLA